MQFIIQLQVFGRKQVALLDVTIHWDMLRPKNFFESLKSCKTILTKKQQLQPRSTVQRCIKAVSMIILLYLGTQVISMDTLWFKIPQPQNPPHYCYG